MLDTIIPLFRLIVKIAQADDFARQPHQRLDPVQGERVRGHFRHPPSSANSPVLLLEVLLGGILTVYAFIALSYLLRYCKNPRRFSKLHTHNNAIRNHRRTHYLENHDA